MAGAVLIILSVLISLPAFFVSWVERDGDVTCAERAPSGVPDASFAVASGEWSWTPPVGLTCHYPAAGAFQGLTLPPPEGLTATMAVAALTAITGLVLVVVDLVSAARSAKT